MIQLIPRIAQKSDHHQHKHVVFVVKGGSIVSTGYNHGMRHAEISALNKVWPNKRKGLIVYSFRLRRDGSLGMAKPCPRCEKFLIDNGIKTVYYSTNEGRIERMKL